MSNITVGVPCPECGHEEHTVTGWLFDDLGFNAGEVLHCHKCEHTFRNER